MINKYNSKVVIGTWSLSGDFGTVEKKIVYKSLEKAIENNFLEFDTAPTYGNGKIYNILSDIVKKNKKIKINTKCGYNSDFLKTFKIEDILKSIDITLEKFDKINILFLHNPRNEIKNWTKIIEILKKYKKKNYINHIGISLARDHYFKKSIMNQFDYLQDEINLLRPHSVNFLNLLKPKLMARSPLASGCLSGKLTFFSKFEKKDYRSSWLSDQTRLRNILFQVNEIKKITGINIKKFSKFFLLQNKNIDKIIFGIKKPSHINELVNDNNYPESLSSHKIKKIYELANLNFNLELGKKGY
jgi:aryl-alcohol dehydrogenase-like predicted oxidoreductase